MRKTCVVFLAGFVVGLATPVLAASCGQSAEQFLLKQGRFAGPWNVGSRHQGKVRLAFDKQGGTLYVTMKGTDEHGNWGEPYRMKVTQAGNTFYFNGTISRMSVQLTSSCTLKGRQNSPKFNATWNLS